MPLVSLMSLNKTNKMNPQTRITGSMLSYEYFLDAINVCFSAS